MLAGTWMSRTRRSVGTLLYTAFLLAFVELALQLFYYVTAGSFLFARAGVPIWAPNEWSGVWNRPHLAYRHSTHEFEAMNFTNGQGLRVPDGGGDYALEPRAGTTRVMLLGPSFAFGWGVDYEATFGHVLERLLEDQRWRDGDRVELINAGVSSLGPAPQLSWFRHVGSRFAPDLVIQFIHGSMAVKNHPRSRNRVTPDGYLVRRDVPLSRELRDRAKKSAIVFYGWILYTMLDQRLSDEGGEADGGEILGAGRELTIPREFSLENPVVVESLAFYRALRDETRRAGAEALVVFFPLSYAIHPEDRSRWRHLGVQDIEAQQAFDSALCQHLAEQESLPCIDITEPMRRAAEANEERLYFWLDVHWTEAGNRVAAQVVTDHLLAR